MNTVFLKIVIWYELRIILVLSFIYRKERITIIIDKLSEMEDKKIIQTDEKYWH